MPSGTEVLTGVACNKEVPVIVNTKLIMTNMASKGLIVLQVSLSSNKSYEELKILEPYAPPPNDRIEFIREASDKGIPTVARLQPFIPGISDKNMDEFVEELSSAGVKQIIVEFLRIKKSSYHFIRNHFQRP